MAGTYTKLLYHFVFSIKHRRPLITPDIESRLHEYMGGIVRSQRGVAIRIGGMPDHVHMLVRWRTDETLATLMRTVKARSSAWVHDTFPACRDFAWQEGCAAFTVSQSQGAAAEKYIAGQQEHHRKRSFQEELIEFFARTRLSMIRGVSGIEGAAAGAGSSAPSGRDFGRPDPWTHGFRCATPVATVRRPFGAKDATTPCPFEAAVG